MLNLSATTQFKKDLKTCSKRNYNLALLNTVIDILRTPAPLPNTYLDHPLRGNYNGWRECHIAPDWLLVYKISEDDLILNRTGTHADIFKI